MPPLRFSSRFIYWLSNRKNSAPAVNGNVTPDCPPLLLTVFVTGIHATGGVKLVVKYNAQFPAPAETGHVSDSVDAAALMFTAKAGGATTTTLTALETLPAPQSSPAATS